MRRDSISSVKLGAAIAAAVVCALTFAAPASATIPASLTTSCTNDFTSPENYVFCDDGVPNAGGLVPDVGGANAITVPADYAGFVGLPPAGADATTVPGADPTTGTVALDTDISYPNPVDFSGPRPLIVFMHGCCSGDKTSWESNGTAGQRFDAAGEPWHYNNAWFASRGYVVINYTARGFVNSQGHGSTGQTQLDSRSYEINDYQSLACQVTQLFNNNPALPDIDPTKVVATGGSYGGGFAWMALTDPRWNCQNASPLDPTFNFNMNLAAVAPRYGWTDLVSSLVPTGMQFGEPDHMPATDGCDSGPIEPDGSACPAPQNPTGLPKTSIVSALYASGTSGVPPGSHTTFAPEISTAFGCLTGPESVDSTPACSGITTTLAEFLRERSAYYQQGYFDNLAADPADYAIPVFDAGTFTDELFPAIENRRMINRLRAVDPSYPLQAYYGDYEHFVQNKATVWGDVCNSGGALHVCDNADYPGPTPADFDAAPASRVREGVTTRLNAFIDHYVSTASGPPDPGTPSFDVTGELQVCPQNAASLGVDPGQGGPQFTAPTFEQLAPNVLTVDASGAQTTTNAAAPNEHAVNSDPVGNFAVNGGKCPTETTAAGPGVASYTSSALPSDFTMLGGATVTVNFSATGPVGQMDARLYDVQPDGTAVMVDRGPRRLTSGEASAGKVTFELDGNGWRFKAGDRIRVELAQDDSTFVRASETASSASLTGAVLKIPIREASASIKASPTLKKGRCANKVVGTRLGDKLIGSPQGDRILGGKGNDRIKGLGGKDCLSGQAGNDRIWGGKGNDTVKGGPGNDRLSGGPGNDLLVGGPGRDHINGGPGNDRILARDHRRDVINCGPGRHDVAIVDPIDKVRGCEKVKRRR